MTKNTSTETSKTLVYLSKQWSVNDAIEELKNRQLKCVDEWLSPCEDLGGKRFPHRFAKIATLPKPQGFKSAQLRTAIRNVSLLMDDTTLEGWRKKDQWFDAAKGLSCWKDNHLRTTLMGLIQSASPEKTEFLDAYLRHFPERLHEEDDANLFKFVIFPEQVDVLVRHGYAINPQRIQGALLELIKPLNQQRYGAAYRLLIQKGANLHYIDALDTLGRICYKHQINNPTIPWSHPDDFIKLADRLLDFCGAASPEEQQDHAIITRDFFLHGEGKNIIHRWLVDNAWPPDNMKIFPILERMMEEFNVPFYETTREFHPIAEALAETLELKRIAAQHSAPKPETAAIPTPMFKPSRRT